MKLIRVTYHLIILVVFLIVPCRASEELSLSLKRSYQLPPTGGIRFLELEDKVVFAFKSVWDKELLVSTDLYLCYADKTGQISPKLLLAKKPTIAGLFGIFTAANNKLFIIWSALEWWNEKLYATELAKDLKPEKTTEIWSGDLGYTNMRPDQKGMAYLVVLEGAGTGYGRSDHLIKFLKFDGQELLPFMTPISSEKVNTETHACYFTPIRFDSKNNPHFLFGKGSTLLPVKRHYMNYYYYDGDKWQTEQEIIKAESPGYAFTYVDMCLDPSDGVHTAWGERKFFLKDPIDVFSGPCPLYYKYKPKGGKWTKREIITEKHEPSANYIVSDNSGNILVVYALEGKLFLRVKRGQRWLPAYQIPDTKNAVSPQIFLSRNGNLIIMWDEEETSKDETELSCTIFNEYAVIFK